MPQVPEEALALYNAHMAFTQQRIEYWVHYNFGTWQWYILLATLVVPFIVWWRLVDKKRLLPIVAMGLMVLATANWMDQAGTELGWWHYPHKPLPLFPQLIPVNFAMLPVGYMLLYQYFIPWPRYLAAAVAMSALMTWVAEPVVVWMGIYKLVSWQYSYSFPIYMIIAYSHKRIIDAIIEISDKAR